MRIVADFHIHSRYSRATSSALDLDQLARWARIKGIGLLGTGDATHPLWMTELKAKLKPTSGGLYEYQGVLFTLTAEVNANFVLGCTNHRIHNLLFLPSMEVAEKLNARLGHYGDLTSDGRPTLNLSARDLVKLSLDVSPDILIVPAHCLPPTTLIHTESGIKEIRDIAVGDQVYTHQGRLRPVTQVLRRAYEGPIYHIKPFYFRLGLKATPEHPFYVIKTYKRCSWTKGDCRPTCTERSGCHKRPFEHYSPKWVPAEKIERGDILIFPRFLEQEKDLEALSMSCAFENSDYRRRGDSIVPLGTRVNKIRELIPVDKALCRLMGYYLAEGYTDGKGCISFCFGEKETEYIRDVQELMRHSFGMAPSRVVTRPGRGGTEIHYFSKLLYIFFSHQFYTNGSKTAAFKRLPLWVLTLPRQKQAEIVKGWWRGDTGYTTSRSLMDQFKMLLLRLGIIPSILIDSAANHSRRGRHEFKGRTIRANHDIFQFSNLSFFDDPFHLLGEPEFQKFKTKMSRRHGWMDEKNIYIPVRDVEVESYDGLVYNLEVEEDNSYVAEFATVHNCWTPHFSIFGANSGFDTVEECFQDQAKEIFCLETGLSSDPAMNWRLSRLDRYTLISNSDSHSASRIGREANVFDCEPRYQEILQILKTKDHKRFLYTIEFFPEEGKYHFDGHRSCRVRFSPQESQTHQNRCPSCGRKVTIGVMHRVEDLADRPADYRPAKKFPFKRLVPLDQIISEAIGVGVQSKAVESEYFNLVQKVGTEFEILVDLPEETLRKSMRPKIAEGILRVRSGEIEILPGYDGEYGEVKIFGHTEAKASGEKQLTLFE